MIELPVPTVVTRSAVRLPLRKNSGGFYAFVSSRSDSDGYD